MCVNLFDKKNNAEIFIFFKLIRKLVFGFSNSDCKPRSDEHLQESLPPGDETVYNLNEINDQAVRYISFSFV